MASAENPRFPQKPAASEVPTDDSTGSAALPAFKIDLDLLVASDAREGEGDLNETLEACLGQLKSDFDRGIVLIDPVGVIKIDEVTINGKSTVESYTAAKNHDKKAGQIWYGETGLRNRLKEYFKADNYKKLKLAMAMPGGPRLIGVYANGEPAIRQRSSEIVNVVVNKEGELILLHHAEASEYIDNNSDAKWGDVPEIFKGVKEAGYRVAEDSPNHVKEDLVAAWEVVTGTNYVESPAVEDKKMAFLREYRFTILEPPKNIAKDGIRHVVYRASSEEKTGIAWGRWDYRMHFQGATLWL